MKIRMAYKTVEFEGKVIEGSRMIVKNEGREQKTESRILRGGNQC